MVSRDRRQVRWVTVLCLAGLSGTLSASVRAGIACDPHRLGSIPVRPLGAPTGTQFARRVEPLTGPARDSQIRLELMTGNLPNFLRQLVPVSLTAANVAHSLTVCVLPDYLAV